MTIKDVDTYAYLIILDMGDFDIILGIHWLSYYHVAKNCSAMTLTLAMSDIHQSCGRKGLAMS